MRLHRCVVTWLAVGLLLTAAMAWAEQEAIVFDTITLQHLTAGEVAPLLGPRFSFSGRGGFEAGEAPGAMADLLPPDIRLVTASSQLSHHLLVAGTPEAVADLRGLLALLDRRPPTLPLELTVYPCAPMAEAGWTRFSGSGASTGPRVEVAVRGQHGQPLVFPVEAKPQQFSVQLQNLVREFVPLPAFRGIAQALLSPVPRLNADGTVTVTLSCGFLHPESPERGVEEARTGPATTINVAAGEEFALLVTSSGGAAVTAVMRFGQASDSSR